MSPIRLFIASQQIIEIPLKIILQWKLANLIFARNKTAMLLNGAAVGFKILTKSETRIRCLISLRQNPNPNLSYQLPAIENFVKLVTLPTLQNSI